MIYFAVCVESRHPSDPAMRRVKIGYSGGIRSIRKIAMDFKVRAATEIRFGAVVAGDRDTERDYHLTQRRTWIRGEWFWLNPADLPPDECGLTRSLNAMMDTRADRYTEYQCEACGRAVCEVRTRPRFKRRMPHGLGRELRCQACIAGEPDTLDAMARQYDLPLSTVARVAPSPSEWRAGWEQCRKAGVGPKTIAARLQAGQVFDEVAAGGPGPKGKRLEPGRGWGRPVPASAASYTGPLGVELLAQVDPHSVSRQAGLTAATVIRAQQGARVSEPTARRLGRALGADYRAFVKTREAKVYTCRVCGSQWCRVPTRPGGAVLMCGPECVQADLRAKYHAGKALRLEAAHG